METFDQFISWHTIMVILASYTLGQIDPNDFNMKTMSLDMAQA